MSTADDTKQAAAPQALSEQPVDPTKMAPTSWHLMLTDKRSPEEQAQARQREADRRAGRKRGKWWEKTP